MSSTSRPNSNRPTDSSTYTRSSMESAAVGSGADTQAGATSTHLDPDSEMAPTLLAAREEERTRLAEELHDGPAQAIANAIFQTEIVGRAIREDPDMARSELLALRQLLERELDALRGYINQLRPSLSEAAGLDEALRDNVTALSESTGLPIELRLDAPSDGLHEAAKTVALRVAQEALRNIAKHSAATRAWVVTSQPDGPRGRWQLEVGDDGRGFDLDTIAGRSRPAPFRPALHA